MSHRNVSEDIKEAVRVLKLGGIILYPTDTVWGIGCDATNPKAVQKIFDIKKRADSKALITLVESMAALERVVANIPEVAEQLVELSDRPTTVIYDKGINVAPEVLAEDGSIGVRLTREAVSAGICRALGRPLVSTSANISGSPAPSIYPEIGKEIIEAVDYVCTSRRSDTSRSKPSLVIKISDDGVFKILRS